MQIPLNDGTVALIDDEDYALISPYKWFHAKCSGWKGGTGYAMAKVPNGRSTRKLGVHRENIRLIMHRLITKAPPGMEVDHINGNGLDNRKCNLRFATDQGQKANSKPSIGKMFKGITHDQWNGKLTGRWRAQICVRGRRIHIGVYATQEEAARAYDARASKEFGEFARLNF